MFKNEQEILASLKHDWAIDSVEQHADGYWDFLDNSFDLRFLKTKQDLKGNELYEAYLTISGDRIIINISGDESYYEVENLNETELDLTCYFQDKGNESELVRLVTFRLSRQ